MKRHCGKCGSKILIPAERDQLLKHFDEVNEKGAARFSIDWIKANQRAAQAAVNVGVDPSDVRMKALLTDACYRILAMMRSSRRG
jgi:hypothetical protein